MVTSCWCVWISLRASSYVSKSPSSKEPSKLVEGWDSDEGGLQSPFEESDGNDNVTPRKRCVSSLHVVMFVLRWYILRSTASAKGKADKTATSDNDGSDADVTYLEDQATR